MTFNPLQHRHVCSNSFTTISQCMIPGVRNKASMCNGENKCRFTSRNWHQHPALAPNGNRWSIPKNIPKGMTTHVMRRLEKHAVSKNVCTATPGCAVWLCFEGHCHTYCTLSIIGSCHMSHSPGNRTYFAALVTCHTAIWVPK